MMVFINGAGGSHAVIELSGAHGSTHRYGDAAAIQAAFNQVILGLAIQIVNTSFYPVARQVQVKAQSSGDSGLHTAATGGQRQVFAQLLHFGQDAAPTGVGVNVAGDLPEVDAAAGGV